jgi:F-type H+-transporting ATPase subunit alpha
VEDVQRFETEFLEHVRASHGDILKEIRETKKFPEETAEKLTEVVNEFKKGFAATDGSSVVAKEAETEPLDPDDLEKESVKVRKPPPKKN